MLDTAYPQLIDIVILTVTGLVSLAVIALTFYVGHKSRRDFPSRQEINRLSGEVSQQSGELADLRERFSRFQKREGLRQAREQKASEADLKAEAAAILQGQDTGGNSKLDLYRKIRGH